MADSAKLESAAAWFEYAAEDIKAARVLLSAEIYPSACFHAQQAAEKAFKGLLSATNEIEKIHSVAKLSKTVHDLKYDEFEPMPKAGKLDVFYMATRYPDMLPGSLATDVYDFDDATDAIKIAEQTFLLLAKWGKDAGIGIRNETIALVQNLALPKPPK